MTQSSCDPERRRLERSTLIGYSQGVFGGERWEGLAWVNSIGLTFLVVGAVGLWGLEPRVGATRPVELAPVEVRAWLSEPREEPVDGEVIPEPAAVQGASAEVVRVVLEPPQVMFSVPTVGRVEVATSLAVAPRLELPAGPVELKTPPVLGLRLTGRGGDYPQPDYPFRLLQARMQGELLLRIEVDDAGAIRAVEIAKSTGYAALDRHTVDHVRRRFRFPVGEGVRVYELPVVYRIP